MRRLAISSFVTGLTLWAYQGAVLGQAADPVVGTWKLNAAKSKFSPGHGLKALTVAFAPAGDGLKVASDATDPDGKTTHTEYTASYDGKDYPLAGSPTADTVTLRKVDATTSVRTDKKVGKVVGTYTRTVSSDGKTLTVKHTGTDAKGQPIDNTLVFEKQ